MSKSSWNEEERSEKVIHYLNNRMGIKERREFEKVLKADPTLQADLDEFKDMTIAIEEVEKFEIQTILRDIAQQGNLEPDLSFPIDEIDKAVSKRPWWQSWWILATGFLILLGAVFLGANYETLSNNYKAKKLFRETKIEKYDLLVNYGENTEANLRTGYEAYAAENFSMASQAFRQYRGLSRDNFTSLYLGVSCILANPPDPEGAIKALEPFRNDDTAISSPIRWYLSLAYLATGDIQNARALLSQISNDNTAIGVQAQELLQKMNN